MAIALSHRNFRLLWIGALASSIGTWVQKVAQAWLIVTLAGSASPFFLGLDTFLGELPLLLFTLIGGVLADRRDRRHMILTSQTIQMLVALGLAVLIHTARIRLADVLTLSFIVGCVRAFGGPAYQSLLPSLVGQDHLPNAIALNSMQDNLARVIGPVVAGVALAAFGMVACFALNGLSFLFVIAAVLALRKVHVPSMAAESMVVQFMGGLRFVQGSPNVITVTALGFTGAFLGLPLLTFLPVITREVFHQDVSFYTRLMAFSGAGAVTGALVVAWAGQNRHMGRMMLTSLALFGTMMVGFALSRTIYVSALILFTAGALLVMCFSLATSLAQLLAPPELRGRVVSFYLVAFLGGSPLGSLASGWLVTKAGSAPMMLAINGTALTLVALYFLIHGHGLDDLDGGDWASPRQRAEQRSPQTASIICAATSKCGSVSEPSRQTSTRRRLEMRKIRIIEQISLDGVIQAPGGRNEGGEDYAHGGWTAPYRSAAMGEAVAAAQDRSFDLLLGRRTYDIFAGYWPKVGNGPIANGLNAATKYVATHRPESLGWGPVGDLGADIIEGVRGVKSQDGPDLIVWGSSTLTSALLEQGLVDEVLLLVYPVLLGRGKRFFSDRADPRALALVSTKAVSSGVLMNTYRYVGSLGAARPTVS